MTCIVGVKHGGKVYLGADSAGVAGLDLITRADAKVFAVGPFLMGFTTSFRMGQLLRYAFKPPKHPRGLDTAAYMVGPLIDEIRRCLSTGGWATKKDDHETGGVFLVGYLGRLFRIDDDYQVGEPVDEFDAVGCGGRYALGSLFASGALEPQARIETALAAAEHFSAGVRRPFVYVEADR